MCEKPLAPSLSDAQGRFDVLGARASNVFLAFNRRFDPGHAALKKAIDSGEIGSLEQLTTPAAILLRRPSIISRSQADSSRHDDPRL